MSSNFGVGGSAFRTIQDREMYVDTVAFPAYRRTLFDTVGLFNEELVRNQDDEFNYRIRKQGGKILLCPDIRSKYFSRSTFGTLWKQYYQYGYWKVRVMQLHPRQMSIRQFVPFAFVSTLVALGAIAIFSNIAAMALLTVIGLYLLGNLAASIAGAKGGNISNVPLVALSFAILHISYGSGFIAGLFTFRNRWREVRTTTAPTN
jgi:succinoglycan biosynthesis protein ExoA